MNESDTFRPTHYNCQPFDSSLVQETIFLNMIDQTPVDLGFKLTPNIFKRAMWVSYAVKHLLRCGLKDDINIELKKAENYLHKARTGEWLKDD